MRHTRRQRILWPDNHFRWWDFRRVRRRVDFNIDSLPVRSYTVLLRSNLSGGIPRFEERRRFLAQGHRPLNVRGIRWPAGVIHHTSGKLRS